MTLSTSEPFPLTRTEQCSDASKTDDHIETSDNSNQQADITFG
eukprot:CAMPEP_0172511176 /NCGR_PEP_ID=MMETSP1066-20121228/234426_1 /TAXON_ID=671091 /ORGANISM="Coscinodiscus wailesii, Strain CCMP2513" /LENGTH=42 /DNA_ID= /DNA_START= /DNA_END= /DNA_ORIENTATION=